MDKYLLVDGSKIKISNPDKLLWPELGITKLAYIKTLVVLSPYILRYTTDRFLSTIRFPNGYNEEFFYQKKPPQHTPSYVNIERLKEDSPYINLDSIKTLIWLSNLAALEFHISFNSIKNKQNPSSIVFDLDPSEGQSFDEVIEVALKIYNTLTSLNITSYAKTSGATGLQIYIPVGARYSYEESRKISLFFAKYLIAKYPNLITIERFKSNRGNKLYFDYLQMWEGKSIIAPYSPRATRGATVSTPITWEELEIGVTPGDFNLLNINSRLEKYGDLFKPLVQPDYQQNLDFICKKL